MHAARCGGEKGVPRKGDLSPLRLVYTPRTVEREYHKDFSQALGRDMELLHFGSSGRALLAFPTSMGRFYQWEDFGLIAAIAEWIDRGDLQVICVDSIDGESWYARGLPPAQRVARHLQYETYILDEVMTRIPDPPVMAGASFGALHAGLLALRHPARVRGFVAMSGALHTPRWLGGYHDDSTYFTNPLAFFPRPND